MKEADIKVKIFIIVIIIIAVCTIALYVYKSYKEDIPYNIVDTEVEENNLEIENIENTTLESIMVHITGEVMYQGVVILKEGDRIVDAIEAAGGETQEADLNQLNLAYILNDGDKIYVPNKSDSYYQSNIMTVNESSSIEQKADAVNINTASLNELMKLPGIGEITANKIIEYRTQNGKFKTIDELKNVPSIGNSKFETLKDKIKVK